MTAQGTAGTSERAPRISDPGGEGWPDEPRGVTAAETKLYGPLAGAVRLLGQAAVAAEEAYQLICKHSQEDENLQREFEQDTFAKLVELGWHAHTNMTATYTDAARMSAAMRQNITQLVHESLRQEPARQDPPTGG